MTEGPTLLPGEQVDKRTKEVFALSLERMNARTARGVARAMDRLDGRSSAQCMVRNRPPDCCMPRNSACPESLFFLQPQALILNGLSRNTSQSTMPATLSQRSDWQQISGESKHSVDRPAVH
ncbi:hypothetical protein C2E19_06035 [Pseudomonas sp. DTU12.3]|nr:hypothetical protein C2E19_06035 [Pseudomonas sp. DTU12.3]